MRLADLDAINRKAIDRRKLVRLLDDIAAGALTIAIDGERQDDAIVAVATAPIQQELKARVHQIDMDLIAFGVRVN